MNWEKILSESVKDGKIRGLYLIKLPVLRNCDNWKLVEVLGWVDYQAKSAYYHGVLVRLKDNIYFVKQASFDAVKPFLNVSHVSKIDVIP